VEHFTEEEKLPLVGNFSFADKFRLLGNHVVFVTDEGILNPETVNRLAIDNIQYIIGIIYLP